MALTKEQAEAQRRIDAHFAIGTHRRIGGSTAEEREASRLASADLDKQLNIRFAGPPRNNLTAWNTPRVFSSDGPATSSDFLPEGCARVVLETEPVIRQTAARALLAEVYSAAGSKSHPYWNASDPSHQSWVDGLMVVQAIADGTNE
jgi:hypothetical protein